MLANIMCWIMAIGLFLSGFTDQNDMYMKLLFMLGFILVGALCKAVDVYREAHKPVGDKKSEKLATESKPVGE